MQQLKDWEQREDMLILRVCPLKDIQEFVPWCKELLLEQAWQMVSLELGADRGQMLFRAEEEDFLLHYEALCDALWIEPSSSRAGLKIQHLIR